MDFAIFLLVNAALFLRPQDLFSSLADVPVYNMLIVLNLIVAAPRIAQQLWSGWRASPAILCVAGILVAIVLSLAVRSEVAGAIYWGTEFAKVVAYFAVMIAVLNTTRRFTVYLAALVTLTVALVLLSVAHFHGLIELRSITHARELDLDSSDGSFHTIVRLAAFGVFADPNDLSMIIVMCQLICLGGLCYQRLGMARFALAAPLAFLTYALALTQSRGGLIALMAGLCAFLLNRFGSWRSALWMAVLMPGLLAVFGGRQSDLSGSIGSGTGSQRTELWYAGLQMMKWHPVLGIGHGKFVEEEGLVAHSSYVQSLAEWGLIGGTMFIGLFYIVLLSVWRLKCVRKEIRSPVLRSMQPYLLGALAAYAASMLTLTRCDCVPTYLVAGMGVSYERLARRGTTLAPLEPKPALLLQVALATGGFIVLLYVYIWFVYRMF